MVMEYVTILSSPISDEQETLSLVELSCGQEVHWTHDRHDHLRSQELSMETTTSDNTDDAYVIITLTPIYDLALTKVLISSGFVESGDVVSFIITLFNQGNQPASNLTITDYIPAWLTLNDTNWTLSGSLATRSFVGPLAPWATGTVTINFIYNGSTTGTLINRSEISTDDGADIDSTPDQTNGTNTESTIDNEINNASGDEDDHDWAEVQGNVTIYDLALRKTFTSWSTTPLVSWSLVTFTITLFNQGNTTANNIQLIDTIPAWLVLSDTDWTASGTNATTNFVGPLAPWATGSVDITLMVDGTLIGTATNHTEIYGDDGSDIDSTTDTNNTNDVLVDDEINNTSGDEDDHDIASILIHRYDLALIKVLSWAQTTFYSGDSVTRTITVFNQGTIDAMNVLVTDYLPAWLTLNDANRTASGTTLTYNTPLAITAGSSQTLSITTTVNGSVTGTITNRAEIHADNGDDVDSTTDQTQANDVFSWDNNTGENGLAWGDEDDHDPAQITVDQIIYPDLFVTKTPDGWTYLSGDTVVRVINYGNNWPATVTWAYLDDQLPSGFTPNPSISFPYYLGFLAVGQTGQLLISWTVAWPSGTVLNNNVQIYYLSWGTTGTETNTGNNQDTGRVELVDPLSCNVRMTHIV